jgi:L-ascorbate metabolism protein UlaG (beta-lactamase superfamily)
MAELKIKWHGHSCFELSYNGHTAVIDPYKDVTGYPELHCEAGEVYASHTQHDDHGYFDAVKIIQQPGASPFHITTIDTFHDPEGGKLRGKNKITVFEADGIRAAHFGDLGEELTDVKLAELHDIDVAMIPAGGFYTIDGVQAAQLAGRLDAKIVIPMHYRRDGRGYDVISGPDVFMNSLGSGFTTYEADDNVLTIKDGKASFTVSGGEVKAIDIKENGRYALLLNFREY